MNRWFARLKREAGFASFQSVLIVGVGAAIATGFLAIWSNTIRPALRDAAAAHLATPEAGATSAPGTGLINEPAAVPEQP